MIAINQGFGRCMIRRGSFAPVVLLLLLFSGCASHLRPENKTAVAGTVYSSVIDIYQGPLNHLSAVRRGQCPMYPSCSHYGREAIAKHGAVIGWMMAMDRLMRCGRSELSRAPLVQINGRWRYYDPVAENDFWWYRKRPHPSGPISSGGSP